MDGGAGKRPKGGDVKTGAGPSRWIVSDGKRGSMRLFSIPYAGADSLCFEPGVTAYQEVAPMVRSWL